MCGLLREADGAGTEGESLNTATLPGSSGLSLAILMEPVKAESRLEQHLQTWAAWMRGSESPDGLPSEASGGMENYSTLDRDSETAYSKLDIWIAETTNTAINDLKPANKAAMYRAYGIIAVFHFPRDNYAELLVEAKIAVAVGLRRRGVWLGE